MAAKSWNVSPHRAKHIKSPDSRSFGCAFRQQDAPRAVAKLDFSFWHHHDGATIAGIPNQSLRTSLLLSTPRQACGAVERAFLSMSVDSKVLVQEAADVHTHTCTHAHTRTHTHTPRPSVSAHHSCKGNARETFAQGMHGGSKGTQSAAGSKKVDLSTWLGRCNGQPTARGSFTPRRMHQVVEEQEQGALLRGAEGAQALLVTPVDGNRSTDIAGTGSRTTSLSDWMVLPVTHTYIHTRAAPHGRCAFVTQV